MRNPSPWDGQIYLCYIYININIGNISILIIIRDIRLSFNLSMEEGNNDNRKVGLSSGVLRQLGDTRPSDLNWTYPESARLEENNKQVPALL